MYTGGDCFDEVDRLARVVDFAEAAGSEEAVGLAEVETAEAEVAVDSAEVARVVVAEVAVGSAEVARVEA